MKRYNHLHKYERTKLGDKGYIVYRCQLPGCSHYIRRELVKGKLCACNICGNPMVMGKYAMRLAKPRCDECIDKKPDKKMDKLTELMQGL